MTSLMTCLTCRLDSLTEFIASHPGGAKPILSNAGTDVTKIFEPIHPKDVISKMLRPDQHLGAVDPATLPRKVDERLTDDELRVLREKKNKPPLGAMINLADIENVARKVMTKQAWSYYRSEAEDGYSGCLAVWYLHRRI